MGGRRENVKGQRHKRHSSGTETSRSRLNDYSHTSEHSYATPVGVAGVRTVAPAFEAGVYRPREIGSALQRAIESFLSPVKTGSRHRRNVEPPSSKLGATVLMLATPAAVSTRPRLLRLRPNLHAMAFVEENRSDDECHQRDADYPVKARKDVAGFHNEQAGDQRQGAAEPAVAEVVWEGERGVADPGRERLDQERRDRTVDHRHVDHLNENQSDQNRHVRIVWIAGVISHRVIDRKVRERGDEIAGHHHFESSDAIGERAEDDEER